MPNPITQLLNGTSHLVLVDLTRIPDGSDDLVFIERIPVSGAIASRIRNHKVRVQLRIECAAGIMRKCRRADIAGQFGLALKGSILLA